MAEEASSSLSLTSDEEEEEQKKKKDAKNAKTLRGAFEDDAADVGEADDAAFSDASSDTLSLDASIAAFVTKMAKDSAKKWRQKTSGGGGGGGGGDGDQNQDSTHVKRSSISVSEGEPVSFSPEIF